MSVSNSFSSLATTPLFGWPEVLILVGCYVVGATPFGLLAGKLKGIDIREHGSGNIGATNVLRVLGKPIGITVLVLDVLKGLIPVLIVMKLTDVSAVHIGAAITTILGHNYTFWLKFKGGKGIATSAGAIAVLIPIPLAIAVVVWVVTFFTSRYVSLASIFAAVSLPISAAIFQLRSAEPFNWPLLGLTICLAVMAVWRHRSNLKRLAAGEENRFQSKSRREKSPS